MINVRVYYQNAVLFVSIPIHPHIKVRGSHSHMACRTIGDQDQNETIKGSTYHFVLNQVIKERFKEAIMRFTKEEG